MSTVTPSADYRGNCLVACLVRAVITLLGCVYCSGRVLELTAPFPPFHPPFHPPYRPPFRPPSRRVQIPNVVNAAAVILQRLLEGVPAFEKTFRAELGNNPDTSKALRL